MILLRLKDFAAGEVELYGGMCNYIYLLRKPDSHMFGPDDANPTDLLRDRLPDRDRELDVRVPLTLYNTTFTKFQYVRLKGRG